MPVVFDAVGTTGIVNASYTGGVAQTYTHTVALGANCVILGIAIVGNGTQPWANHAPTSVTFGGQAMTLIGFRSNNNVANGTGFVALYFLMTPPTGAQTVSITAPLTGFWWANTVSYSGVGTVGVGDQNSGSSTNPTTGGVAATPVVGQIVVAILGALNVAVSAPTQTSRFTQSGTSNIESGFIEEAAGAAAVSLACTAATAAWATKLVYLNPAGAVAIDNRNFIANTNRGTTAVNLTLATPTGLGVAVIAGLGFVGSGAAAYAAHAPTAISYGGQAMTLIGFAGNNAVTNATGFVALYGLLNPTSRGSQTFSVTAGASATTYWGGVAVFTGVGKIDVGVTNTGSSTNPTTGAIATVTNTHAVIAQVGTLNQTVSGPTVTGGSGTAINLQSATTTSESGYFEAAAPTTTAVTISPTAATAAWAAVAVDLEPITAYDVQRTVAVLRSAFY